MYTLNFLIHKDADGFYCANCTNAFVVTDGKTFDELVKNIKEASELFFEDYTEDMLAVRSPYYTLTFSDKVYA